MTMQELIERLEKATGESRDLDYAIDELLNGNWRAEHGFVREGAGWWSETPPIPGGNGLAPPAYYTASIDAALTLVPEDRDVILKIYGPGENVAFCPFKDGSFSKTFSKAATPAIALCVAALKARMAADVPS